jgi:hypothetical protein
MGDYVLSKIGTELSESYVTTRKLGVTERLVL